ncbi:ATP synthase mitochondrial F1 complex assembly factor 2 [Plasmodium falciparum NF54]|uniref:ATP synthase mitochondrial F1 complex assembly factor 2, putative n=2 Tax=Plasmodium falciparum TaxID=5833 RepID=C6S3D4_PLAF7|nr:ATP synthase mitochondrial F1 complex assembly factor 2, putative [Plasmodium falciparum 3D7]KAF4328193.1 ATP synthase mitochondrial F1 complex assembly factor 2 [Plasmodium falciparum NF54]PKC43635.1 ATP synthase mitochondrial F1 complex assembly factor 2 [Plasmodium falciparum NF54]CZT98507.1 ATP synthase mitochondrial F1 complex assembly factor 2, putative [Plasmodium falciparum 3D7]|eukprot:XP_002585411.1 ATP synthase mitochondrial F1 complex assembly factor 2, putative [Plasmodium falciparum 3D7]
MFKKRLNKNVFSIFKKYNSSYICFDENKQNLKKFCNIKNIELRKNVHTNKTEIFIDDKILLTNRKNVFSLKNEDLCLLIKLEILRNKNNMDVLKTPITLCVNNLIDFVNLKEHNMLPKNYDHKYNNKGDNKYNNKGDNKYNNKGDSEYNKCDSEYNKCDSEYNKCDSEYNKCDSEYNKCDSEYNKCDSEYNKCDSEYNNKGDNKYNNKDYSEYNKGDHFNYHNYINNNNKERILYFFEIERTLMEKKIYENFINDLIFYTNNNEEHAFNMHKNSLHDLKKKTIHLPNCLNYINKYNINNNLYQEQKYIYNKFINLFEHIHNIKLNRANHFETPEQNFDVQEKIQKLIKNMNNSEIFLFYKCTQYLNSFIFTYLFLNRYINYKDVYRYCNLEYIYQFFKWGYVYDVNIMKDANTLLMLSSLRLINKMIQ